MRLTYLVSLALCSVGALSNPMDADLTKRSQTCDVNTNGALYRRCAKLKCDAVGQYKKGDRVRMACITSGEEVNK